MKWYAGVLRENAIVAMRNLFTVTIMMSGILCLSLPASAATTQSYGVITSGYGSNLSSSFLNISNIGQGGGESESTYFRNYNGTLALQTVAPAINLKAVTNNMVFSDESPVSNEWQSSPAITFKVTLEVTNANTIQSVSYKISNAGLAGLSSAVARTDAAVDTIFIPGKKVRYAVTIPTASGETLSRSEENYIQWFARNNAGDDAAAVAYRIRVLPLVEPRIVITQPDAKGGFSGTLPEIAATVTGQTAIDASSIQIRLDAADGTNVLLLKSSQNPGIYARGMVSYRYRGAPLKADATYRLTISATDSDGTAGSSTLSFVVKGGAIADLVPYPSPCDPRIQPVTIRYILNRSADVTIKIYDTSGHLVRTLISNEARDPGINEDRWSGDNFTGADLANGIYFCEIVAKDSEGEHRRYTSLAILGK